MRICDKCKGNPIATILVDLKTDEEIDLCVSCTDDFYKWKGGNKGEAGHETLAQVPRDDLKTKYKKAK